MNDILPEECKSWQSLEQILLQCLASYGYQEIRFPIVESTQLFKRSIGEITDIVEKEMYTFTDLNGSSLTLRPEGTAGCIRACLERGLLYNQQQRLWYSGPMFRHEKPQKGRYRQFHQLGVEAIGFSGTGIEVELVALSHHIWQALGLSSEVKLQINTLGTNAERQVYKAALVDFLQQHLTYLDEDSKRRLNKNPLRILDSKNREVQTLLTKAPQLIDFLNSESLHHFEDLRHSLDILNIPFEINPLLVRGIDYYSHTVFEWVTDLLGSQSTLCAGGRYDALIEQLNGKPTPAAGWGLGIERLLLLLSTVSKLPSSKENLKIVMISDKSIQIHAQKIAENIRKEFPAIEVKSDLLGGSFKSQFKRADKSGAHFALILGEDELRNEQISVKNLRQHQEQVTLFIKELPAYLLSAF